MKNRVIKKIMAYLLVGAMVITTPMTASASEGGLPEAYGLDQSGAGAEGGENTGNIKFDTGSGTGSGTVTGTQAIEIPGAVIDKIPQILGISLDPTSLTFDESGQTKPIQARVIFDAYEAEDEEMEWATDPIKLEQKKEIEDQIRWFSDDYNVATFASNEQNDTKTGAKAVVKSVGGGQTKIYAWIEADGQVYVDAKGNPMAIPTPGDFIAEATVTVKNTVKGIEFNVTNKELGFETFSKFANGKRQYDLRKYTILEYTDGTKELASSSNVNLTYSINDPKKLKDNKVTATLTDAGILKISKGDAGKTIDIDIVSEDGVHAPGIITLVTPNPVTKIDKITVKPILDLGIEQEKTKVIDISGTITNKDGQKGIDNSTDELIWSSNKPAIVDVQSEGNGEKATVIAKGVGSAKITVKASSGKNASTTVTVYATPFDVKFEGATTGYSGQPIALTAVLLGDNDQELPLGTTKLKWEIAKKGTKKDPNAKISAKKDIATVTPANLLTGINLDDLSQSVDTTVNVTATYKDPKQDYKKTKPLELKSHAIALKQSNIKDVSIDIFQRVQNDGKEHNYDIMYTMDKNNGKNTKETWAITFNGLKGLKVNGTTKNIYFYAGQKYFMEAKTTDPASQNQMDSIAWAVTGKSVKSDINGTQLTTDFTGNAKTTVKASYITLDTTGRRTKVIKNTKTINITPIQNATSIAFAKPVVVKNPAKNTTKPQAVSFAIKDIIPKKANYGEVKWKVMAYDAESKNTLVYGMDGDELTNTTVKKESNLVASQNNKSVKINVPGNFKAGSVIKVGAYTQVGVVAYGYIYITEQTTKVIPMASKNDAEATEAGTKSINAQTIKLGSGETLKLSAKLDTKVFEGGKPVSHSKLDAAMGEHKLGNGTYSTTTAYQTEPVTYSLDKKSALIVKVDANGNVTPLKKGTATVTIKTLSNKSAKVKIIVE